MNTTTQTKHTPLPWYKQGSVISPTPTGKRFTIAEVYRDSAEVAEANAAFIVRACNSHYELLEACKRAVKAADNPEDFIEGNCAYEALKAAIALAEKGEQK